jgi:hypothetical protein
VTVLFGLFRHLKSYQPLALKLSALALIGLMIAAPLLKPEMLCGDDFQWHLSNAIELDRLIGDGVWYPRWSPDVAFGYGLPNFDFYSPLPRYLSVVIHRLGMPMREATKMPAVLALMLAGPAMYLLARSLYGERAGMVAGLAYACAPYLADDALQRFALRSSCGRLDDWASICRARPGAESSWQRLHSLCSFWPTT